MGFKSITGVHWTNLELEGLLEDEDSCVYYEKVKKHLGLHPFHLTDLNAALREILNVNLNRYDTELNGLVLAYKNPKLLSPLGDIMYDTCFVHVDVEADFYIFRPEVGRSLKGFVNKKGTNHIGILLHKAFNVSVPKPEDEEDWPGDKVKVGQEVRFTPEKIDFKTRLPYIRGLMREEEYLNGCKLFNEQIAATFESEFQGITREYNKEEKSNIKKITFKTENKRVFFDSDNEDEKKPSIKDVKIISNDTEESNNVLTKKRKRRSTLTSESEAEFTQPTITESPKNPSKKRKKNAVINEQSPNDTDDEKPRKPSISELTQRKLLDDLSETESLTANSPVKKIKKSKKNGIDEFDNEKKQKSALRTLVNQSLDFSTEQTGEDSLKKSKKRKNIVTESDEEKKQKSILKTLVNPSIDTPIEKTGEDSLKKSKKRKNIVTESDEEKKQKSILKTLVNPSIDSPIEQTDEDSIRKSKKQKKIVTESDEEKKQKTILKTVVNPSIDSPIEQTDEDSIRKSKKQKKIVTESDEEKKQKTILKTLVNPSIDSPIEQTDEDSIRKSKKQKKIVTESDEEKKQKTILKTLVNPSIDSPIEQTDEDSVKKLKKRMKKSEETVCLDTEDEKEYKSTIVKTLTSLNSEGVFEVPNAVPKKRKKKTSTSSDTTEHMKKIADYEVVDTEDEKRYKKILKPLIECVEQNTQEDNAEFKVPKKKKHKKKRTTSSSETELTFDSSTVVVKNEPESDTEEIRAMKRKLKKAKKQNATENGNNSESDTKESLKRTLQKTFAEQSDVEVKPKQVKISKHSEESNCNSDSGVDAGKPVKSEEEQEKRKKLKKEKQNNDGSK